MAEDKFFQDRLKVLEEIREMGIDPYAYRFDVTHSTKQVLEKYADITEGKSKEVVAVAGRIVLLRRMKCILSISLSISLKIGEWLFIYC